MHRPNFAFDRRRLVALVAAMVVVTGLGGGVGAAVQDEAETSVRRLAAQIIQMLSSDSLDQSDEGDLRDLAKVIEEEADLDLLGQLVLGHHWRTIDDQQKAEYLRLFRQLMLRKFASHLHAYTGDQLGPPDEVFEITGSRKLNDRDIIVESKVRPPDREPLDVGWRLRGPDDPVIIDVVVENVSLLISQRSEFAAVIERRGIEGLLAELKARLGRAAPATSGSASPSPRA
jgi:phospholipid transport system substrate-binding protein